MFCKSYSTKSNNNNNNNNFVHHSSHITFPFLIQILWTDNNTTSEQEFLTAIQENLDKLYVSFDGGSSSNDIRLFSCYTYLIYILIFKFIEAIGFIEVHDSWKWLLNVL